MAREVFVWDEKTQSVVSKEEYAKNHIDKKNDGITIIQDITPFKSVVNGQWITSRAELREHEKRYNVKQVGNDIKPPFEQ